MDSNQHTTRRRFLKGGAAAFVVPAAALPCLAKATPLRSLYQEWRAAMDAARSSDWDDATYQRICAIEQAVEDTAPETLEDMALKIVVADCDGDMTLTLHQVALVREAKQIAGLS